MNEKQLRQTVVTTAKAWLGRKEADGSHTEIIDVYNTISPLPVGYRLSYSDSWCAGFVSAVAQKVELTDIIFPECSCPRMIELYKRANRWQEDDAYVPQMGDVIFYDWDDNGVGDCVGESDHVGLVTGVSGSYLTLIEGNKSDAVGYRNLTVNARYIRGYGLPDYASKADELTDDTAEDIKTDEGEDTSVVNNTGVKLPVIEAGDIGQAVQALQALLDIRGYTPINSRMRSGAWDGEAGEGTCTQLARFQQANGLEPTGIADATTWLGLIGGLG